MKYNLRLTKIDGKPGFRDDTVGWGEVLPAVGVPFVMLCASRDPDATDPIRMLITSRVEKITATEDFYTKNSTYWLRILKPGEPLR